MADAITERLNNFILTEEEKDVVAIEYLDIQPSMKECEVSLFGKAIYDEKVNFQGVKNTMSLAWGHPAGLRIKEIGWNFFQFIFKDKESRDKIWFATPWLYDKYLLNVHPWEPGLRSNSQVFDNCNMWVQVWNIPLHWLSKDVGRKLGQALGGTVDIVIPDNGSKEGRYMRIKVTMNINRPLPRGKWLKLGLETIWVEIRYENLPYVCYYCGLLGHNDRTCVQREKDIRLGNLQSDQFGTWLCAENPLLASDNQPRQGVNTNNDGNTKMKNPNFELDGGNGGAGSSKYLLQQNLLQVASQMQDVGNQTMNELQDNRDKAPEAAWNHDMFAAADQAFPFGQAGGGQAASSISRGTKLYISNLSYDVSNEDIKEVLSEAGDLKCYAIHYDRSGRSKGTAEVVFSRRQDALAAVKWYNNVQLDGKPMKIEIVGTNIATPAAPAFNGSFGFGDANGGPRSGQARGGGFGRSRGGRGRGRGFRGGSRGWGRGDRGEKVYPVAMFASTSSA